MMKNWRPPVLLLGVTLACGCGEILEVPIDLPSTETSESEGTGTGIGDATSGVGTTRAPDADVVSSSGTMADGSSSSGGGGVRELITCVGSGEVIPEDETWLEAPIELPAPDHVFGLRVAVRIVHERVSHLRVRVRAPDGTLAFLLDTPSCQDANVDAIFDDDGALSAAASCELMETSAIIGSVQPLDAIAPLLGAAVEGTWTVEAADVTPELQGTLDQVCIILVVEDG